MVLFWPIQQELDCVSSDGNVLGKIKFDAVENKYEFVASDTTLALTPEQQLKITERLAGLASGKYNIPMQDDD